MILIGVAVFTFGDLPAAAVKAIICGMFILITSPTSAHALSRGSHRGGVPLWPGSVVDKYQEYEEKGQ
jgi:multicomponent Na+:H+ antiporter subunit G